MVFISGIYLLPTIYIVYLNTRACSFFYIFPSHLSTLALTLTSTLLLLTTNYIVVPYVYNKFLVMKATASFNGSIIADTDQYEVVDGNVYVCCTQNL